MVMNPFEIRDPLVFYSQAIALVANTKCRLFSGQPAQDLSRKSM